jgi:hypothetical protein
MLAKAFLGDRLGEAFAVDEVILEEERVELAVGHNLGGEDGEGEAGIVVAGASDFEDGGVRGVKGVGREELKSGV